MGLWRGKDEMRALFLVSRHEIASGFGERKYALKPVIARNG
jgi:hypothetical protein